MLDKLLVCTDGSAYGETACDYALYLAKAFGCRLTALHVLDIRMIEGPLFADVSGMIGAGEYAASFAQFRELMEEKGQAICKWFAVRAADAGIEADCLVETSHPLHAILAKQGSVDLLILGRRGENEQYGLGLVGSTADRAVRRFHKPCLVTPSSFKPVTSIVAGCDGSPFASKVLDMAVALALRLKAPLTVLTVAERMTSEQARRIAEESRQKAAARGCDAAAVVKEGMAADAIVETLSDTKCDLVVLGAHSHTRIREWFVGCTTMRVLADSAVPALLVR